MGYWHLFHICLPQDLYCSTSVLQKQPHGSVFLRCTCRPSPPSSDGDYEDYLFIAGFREKGERGAFFGVGVSKVGKKLVIVIGDQNMMVLRA